MEIDVAALVLRIAVGGTLVAHGVRHLNTLEGTAGWFKSIGFKQPRTQARASVGVEIAAGVALVLGVATPLAAAAVIGTMVVAFRSVHVSNGFFITSEGYEYVLNLIAAAVVIAALGGARFSVDGAFLGDPFGDPLQRIAIAAGLGFGGAALQLAVFWRAPARAVNAGAEGS